MKIDRISQSISQRFPRFSKTGFALFALTVLSLAIRVYHVYYAGGGFYPDSTQYLSMASNLIDNGRLESFGAMFPDIMRPVLYPLLVSFVYFLSQDVILSGIIVSVVSGVLTVVVVFYIARELFDHVIAITAGIIVALNPTLVAVSSYCLTDSLGVCLLLLSYLFGLRLVNTQKTLYAILTGIFFSLAFLTRQIAEIHFYSFLLFFLGVIVYKKNYIYGLKNISVLVIVAAITLSPYLYFTHKQAGHIVLNTGKDYFGVKKSVLQHKINDGFYEITEKSYGNMTEPFKKLINYEIAFRALNDKNDRLLSFDYYYKTIQPQKTNNAGVSILMKENIKNVLSNAYDLLALLWHSNGWLLLFFLAGLYLCIANGRLFALVFIVFAIGADIILILLEHHEDRYAINILAFYSIITAYGLTMTIYYEIKNIKSAKPLDVINNVLLPTLVMLSIVWNLKIYTENMNRIKAENNKLIAITDSIAKYIKPGSSIAARYPTYAFLLKGDYIPLPIAEYENTLEYLKRRKADYLIMSPDAIKFRPFLSIPKLNKDKEFALLQEITINDENWFLYKKILSPE